MRILHVIRTLNQTWGGPVEGVRNITAQALAQGYTPEILCVDDPAAPWLQPWIPKVYAVGSGISQYGFTWKLDRWLAANIQRYDVVIVHSIWMYFSYAVWKATRKTKVPYYLFVHGALDPWFKERYPLKHIKKRVYWKSFEHKVLRDAERVLFTSKQEMLMADQAFSPYICNPQVTGYGITKPLLTKNFDKGRALQNITAAHSLLRNRNFILLLARVHEKKGIDLLFKAFAAAKSKLSGTALVIAGSSDDNPSLQNNLKKLASSLAISDDVVWTGPLYGANKWEILRAADVYALPSHQENFGISVVESLACGTPVLISDKVNICEEIRAARAGFVAPDSVAGTIELLQRWSNLSSQAKLEMRSNAAKCFADYFDLTVNCSRLFATLKSSMRDGTIEGSIASGLAPASPNEYRISRP